MREARGNLWTFPADIRVITTNGTVKKDGTCVMGRGCALEAKNKWPGIAKALGNHLMTHGNHVGGIWSADVGVYSFPVKHEWHQKADPALIRQSAVELVDLVKTFIFTNQELRKILRIVLPRPGCGNGQLKWEDVKPILEPILDDRFTVITF